MIFLSPAKVNLGLWILGKRDDGYHEILTIMQTVDLFDEIYIEEGPLSVSTNIGIPQEENLVYKALLHLERLLGKPIELKVHINKRIPVGSGLGGGSSNVGTVLREVNRLLGEPLDEGALMEIASKVSSDAPFFIKGGSAVSSGRGEKIMPVDLPPFTFTVVYPNQPVFTAKVYSLVREENLTSHVDVDKILNRLREGDFSLLSNELGRLACEAFPVVGECFRFLESLGLRPMVSGSGSCVFYVGRATEEVMKGCQLRGWQVFEVKSWPGV
ncbi:4-(cytidine 5'-diphospho)-2-C-methyl-D-erythritol kinase [Thermocrinis minervae]|uniref:4-diphosphocytidyl-2-C-methyl-D-erythritol kinase n=1 Tax=Thermocrinis minervae TaxID=381751 RepID=A0A1M6T2I9_9AQUI|nr:4-(cytidine 5'-diphospho)-2-C-methyl-D-erythritol kinase [Thermocrinis minervae]SHK51212.1 4-diphosphocytidyl-2-C-methyl-D-erythritol kinase [Thermocrinis minervae]